MPLPRAALPAYADGGLSAVYAGWRAQAVSTVTRERTNAMVHNIMHAARPAYSPYAAFAGAGAAGTGYGAYNGFGGNSGGGGGGGVGGGGDNDHATVMDTVTTLGSLANTILGTFGGGGIGGGLGALTGGAFGGTGFFGN